MICFTYSLVHNFVNNDRNYVQVDIQGLYVFEVIVSQLTVETYFFADGLCLFKQLRSVIYIPLKKSVGPFVTLTKSAYSFISNSRS